LGGNPPFQPNASLANGIVDQLGPTSGGTQAPLVVTTQSKDFKNPEAWAWNFTFEREMFGSRWSALVTWRVEACTSSAKRTSTNRP